MAVTPRSREDAEYLQTEWTHCGAESSGTATAEMKGHHRMDGEVTQVDSKRGWIDVKTSEG